MHLHRQGTSTDIVTHLLTAYRSSSDEKLRLYVDRLEDSARDKGIYLEEKDLMNRVKRKFDALETIRKLEQVAKEDDVVALKAQIKNLKKAKSGNQTTDSSGSGTSSGSGGGRGGKRGKEKKKKDGKKEYIPFPKELRKKPEPSDLTKPLTINGVNYFFCKKHKWCKHKNSECKGIDRNPGNNATNEGNNATAQSATNSGGSAGDRAGRTIRAVGAVVQE